MNSNQLSRIVLRGFKSIRDCDLELKNLNILVGPNGAGKSNFIGFFKLIQEVMRGQLQLYVGKQGGPDSLLHFGRKKTKQISAELYFGNNSYKFTLEPTQDNRMMFASEKFGGEHLNLDLLENSNLNIDILRPDINAGHFETLVKPLGLLTNSFNALKAPSLATYSYIPAMNKWMFYHFHDTSDTAAVKQRHGINDNEYLRQDARNLAAFLYLLKNQFPAYYQRIVNTIQLMAPFFGDFYLRPQPDNKEQIELEWSEKNADIPFKAYHLSDGTLRFICLATLLLQPEQYKPELILIDEPELGLHPYAIKILASLLKTASKTKQIIISTQSVTLLDEFKPEDVIVADRAEGWAHLQRLDARALSEWLNEYSLGELWQKNLLGGRPSK